MTREELAAEVFGAFAADAALPRMSLRGGDALDSYREPPPFDASQDGVSDAYLEQHFWGVAHLDPDSWRHYLPHLIAFALRHVGEGSNAVDALLLSLRPPDREPPRLGSLSTRQSAVVAQFLEDLAFASDSAHQELACQVLEEAWLPGALYRPPPV